MNIKVLTDMDVRLVSSVGSDRSVIAAAKVSTSGEESLETLEQEAREGLINYLMKNRHGTPFEHASMTFFIKAPILVFREFHRHRIGWSYNEESARYKQLAPEFYIPMPDRPGLLQVEGGRPGQYEYTNADHDEWEWLIFDLIKGYADAYVRYEERLQRGYAKEIARAGLPVAIYSSMYATCNPRSLMAFLSLRTKRNPMLFEREELDYGAKSYSKIEGGAMFPSKPQWEINRVADLMEAEFKRLFPIVYKTWNDNGRVAP